jgi:large subunit ribosomal protein L22
MRVRAVLKNHRGSARKARLVVDLIRGKPVGEALTVLDFSNKRMAKPIAKLVRSAVASAEEKNTRERAGIDLDNLVVKTIHVDRGPSMWRIRPRAQGRATWIQRRTSHITVVLEEV